MKKIFLSVFLFCLSFSIFTAESSESQLDMIVLLNGTSSAGKSSIIRELQKQSENGFFIANLDQFEKEYEKDNFDDFFDDFYKHVKNLSLIHPKILVDTVQYELGYEKYDEILGKQVVKILVYCPLSDILKRVKKRNQSGDEGELRSVVQAFKQFFNLYKMKKELCEEVIDIIHTSTIKNVLREIKREYDEFDIKYPESIHVRAEKYNKLVKRSADQFHYNQKRKISLATKQNCWDLVINSGINSPELSARKIADYLETKV